jgi:low affinity Fe/Cu permease
MSKNQSKPFLRELHKLYNFSSHPYTFIFVFLSIIGWFIIGGFFHFEETWYKWFHLYDMVITLMMIFIIESTQQADDQALQEKLDEILRSLPKANDQKIGLEKKYKGQE